MSDSDSGGGEIGDWDSFAFFVQSVTVSFALGLLCGAGFVSVLWWLHS